MALWLFYYGIQSQPFDQNSVYKVFILKKFYTYLNHALKGKSYANIQTLSGITSSTIISETDFIFSTNNKIFI